MAEPTALTPRLRAALEQLPALVVVMHGPELRVAVANPRRPGLPQGSAFEGLTAEVMLERTLADPADRERFLAALREVVASGRVARALSSRVLFVGADEPTWWDVTFVPLRDGPDAPPDGVVLHATEVTRLVQAHARAEEAELRYTALAEADVVGVCVADGSRWLEVNDTWLAIIGRSRAEFERGLSWTDVTAPEYADADRAAIVSLMDTGTAAPYEKVFVRPDGSRVPVLVSASVLSREPMRILGLASELSERKSAEAAAAALLARTRRLQEVTATVFGAQSTEEIARAVVHNGLEELGASAGVLIGGDEDATIEHAAGLAPEQVAQWRAFPATIPLELTSGSGALVPSGALLPGGRLVSFGLEGRGGERLGSVAFAFRDAARELDADELGFVLALSRQAGLALDRIRLYEDRAYVARKLQEGLLPARLAAAPGLEAAVVYESISGGGEVGGDFYDFFASGPGGDGGVWTAVVGDVCGKGTEAAVTTGLARHTLRAIAQTTDSPAALLAFLNAALRDEGDTANFVTVACATLVPDPGGGWAATVSSGGHPFPLLLRADGALEEVGVVGTMLGVADGPELAERTVRLAPGDALVLYTDGVTDARPLGGRRFGEPALLDAVRAATGESAEGIAQAVERAVRAHLPGASADDRAILVLRAASG